LNDPTPTFVIGRSFAAYFGQTVDNTPHQHAAIQLVLGARSTPSIFDDQMARYDGNQILIRPMVMHSLQCSSEVAVIYIEPQSTIGRDLIDLAGPEDVSILTSDLDGLLASREPDQILSLFQSKSDVHYEQIDCRLSRVIHMLESANPSMTISEAAEQCFTSVSTIRMLARKQMGIPLSTWLIWRKLSKASKALANGANLSQAANDGGFSDQAHFSRTMRRMFGISPALAMRQIQWQVL